MDSQDEIDVTFDVSPDELAANKVTDIISDRDIKSSSFNIPVIEYVQKQISKLTPKAAGRLIKLLLTNRTNFFMSDIVDKGNGAKLFQYNMAKIEKDPETKEYRFKPEYLNTLRILLKEYIRVLKNDSIIEHDVDEKNVKELQLSKLTDYKRVCSLLCDYHGQKPPMYYDFDEPDMEAKSPKLSPLLQRSVFQLYNMDLQYEHPLAFYYYCSECEHEDYIRAHETASMKTKIVCRGDVMGANGKMKRCGLHLVPDMNHSVRLDCTCYNVNYFDEFNNCKSAQAFSHLKLRSGQYDCVIFRIGNDKGIEQYHIVDVKNLSSNSYSFPSLNPTEHYAITLMRSIDEYIKEKTRANIYGMIPLKLSFIMQKVFQACDFSRVSNIMIVGKPSTGKTYTASNYLCTMNGYNNISTSGLSVSIPSLRGTRNAVSYAGKEFKQITPGYFGMFHSILIDEAGQNKELVEHLKTFLCADTYAYQRAGSNETTHKRLAHVSITQNIDPEHIGAYRGRIRKLYQAINTKIGNEEKIPWDESWDLEQPLYTYDNPYLYKIIKDVRLEFHNKQIFWIDGYDVALHERFPFYFYVVADKESDDRSAIVRKNAATSLKSIPDAMLTTMLASNDIDAWFTSLNAYIESDTDEDSFKIIGDILKEYHFDSDERTKKFYYALGKASRIINCRKDMNALDFEFIRYIIENTNCKIDVADTGVYQIKGPGNASHLIEMDKKTEVISDIFGMQLSDF